MRRCVLAVAGLVLASAISEVRAGNEKDGVYYCVPQVTSGVAYDEQGKRWIASAFKPAERFVVRFQFERQRKKIAGGTEWVANEYKVWATREGSNHETACTVVGSANPEIVRETDVIRCDAVLFDLTFNRSTNRFVAAHLHGFVSGRDNNDDTPAISIGMCTGINK